MPKRQFSHTDLPDTVSEFRKSEKYILESQLTSLDFLHADAVPCGIFKGSDPIYYRTNVSVLRSRAVWDNRFNRSIKKDEKPVRVISRSEGKTTDLFSVEQTEVFANLIAENGNLPTNEYGNVHIDRLPLNTRLITCKSDQELKIAIRVCKLNETAWCKGQSGWKRKFPVFAGVVVLEEDFPKISAEIQNQINAKIHAEEESCKNAALAIWKTLISRITAEYYIQTRIDPPR